MEPSILKGLFYAVFIPLFGWEALTNIDNIKGHFLFAVLLLAVCFRLYFYVVRQRQIIRKHEMELREMKIRLNDLEDRQSDPTTKAFS